VHAAGRWLDRVWSWVTDEPDHRDVEPASLEFRFLVAMAGVLGVGANLLNWTERDRARAVELVALYRSIRRTIFAGRVEPHGNPADPVYALEYGTSEQTVLLVYGRANRPTKVCINPRTIDMSRRYRVAGTQTELNGVEVTNRSARPLHSCARCGPPHPGCAPMNSVIWRPVPLSVRTDPVSGGRWTSLRSFEREWLWTNPDSESASARMRVVPGDAFVDAGGAEECFPSVRGTQTTATPGPGRGPLTAPSTQWTFRRWVDSAGAPE
jgi:hypothetical protein